MYAIIFNQRIWIHYYIKIGKDASNPLRVPDSELFDFYAPKEII